MTVLTIEYTYNICGLVELIILHGVFLTPEAKYVRLDGYDGNTKSFFEFFLESYSISFEIFSKICSSD